MIDNLILITGVWTQVVGTVIAAIGETMIIREERLDLDPLGYRVVSIGNGFEATGNALQAVGAEKLSDGSIGETYRVIGDWIQFSGNVTNVYAAELQFSGKELEGLNLDVFGDTVQSIGAGLEAYGATLSTRAYSQLLAYGNTLQSLGAALEAVGEVYILREMTDIGLQITTFGSYAQAAGATIAAIALTKQYG
ncbi:hypothetical protein FHE72_03190 [Rossellomorea vietnamensis]|uniref:Uncharacterized protein n=1 Tax=Rossellomorea vietnamensis TaxID=218284 RepID=A0A6I6UMA4_9BACI|nr:hypothetical protein [Rossellomorea vietnamensis]QHE60141.1 hypothetical protein FHE72_03190 [Rossellomorea vietnamensis]